MSPKSRVGERLATAPGMTIITDRKLAASKMEIKPPHLLRNFPGRQGVNLRSLAGQMEALCRQDFQRVYQRVFAAYDGASPAERRRMIRQTAAVYKGMSPAERDAEQERLESLWKELDVDA